MKWHLINNKKEQNKEIKFFRQEKKTKSGCFHLSFLKAFDAVPRSLFSRVLRDSTPHYISPSVSQLVGWLVGQSPFYFFSVFELFELYIETSPEWQGLNSQLIIRTSRMRVRVGRGSDEKG